MKPESILRLTPVSFCCPLCRKEHDLQVDLCNNETKYHCKCADTEICILMTESEGSFNISRLDDDTYRITSCSNGRGVNVNKNANVIRAMSQTTKECKSSIMGFDISPLCEPRIFMNGKLAQDLKFDVIYTFEKA